MLDQAALARTLPVGDTDKADVRAVAAALGLRTAAKPDSQDVCFITRPAGGASSSAAHPFHPAPSSTAPAPRSVASPRSSW